MRTGHCQVDFAAQGAVETSRVQACHIAHSRWPELLPTSLRRATAPDRPKLRSLCRLCSVSPACSCTSLVPEISGTQADGERRQTALLVFVTARKPR